MTSPAMDIDGIRHVHLTAICGVGMAALAGLLQQRGLHVTGSDEHVYPPMSDTLQRLGIAVREGYRAENIADRPDAVIIGNKVSRDNPEVQAVLASGIPYLSFPDALGQFFLAGRQSLVVAGTHGKTTSTALLAWILEHAGLHPSMLVGGHSIDFAGNLRLASGRHFVVEGDEYDSAFFDKRPKFVHYRPAAVLLTSVEFDHADIYADLGAVKDAFRSLMRLLPAGAPLAVCADFPDAVDVAAAAATEPVTFGFGEAAQWRATDLADDGRSTRFTVRHGDRPVGVLQCRLPGAINARNALGCYVLAETLAVPGSTIAEAIAGFSGIARRQEVVGVFGGVTLIDDFAHHPTAVAGVLEALRGRYATQRLWALFEPRSNTSRRRVFQQPYVRAFAPADRILITSVFAKSSDRIDATEMFSTEQLAADLQNAGKSAAACPSVDEIVATVTRQAEPGDVVVMMSNGDFGGLRRRLAAALQTREPHR